YRLNWGAGGKRIEQAPEYSVFVGDLSPEVTDAELKATFLDKYASVLGAKVVTNPMTGSSKSFGFIRFGDEQERDEALTAMNGAECCGRPIRVAPATKRTSCIFYLFICLHTSAYACLSWTIVISTHLSRYFLHTSTNELFFAELSEHKALVLHEPVGYADPSTLAYVRVVGIHNLLCRAPLNIIPDQLCSNTFSRRNVLQGTSIPSFPSAAVYSRSLPTEHAPPAHRDDNTAGQTGAHATDPSNTTVFVGGINDSVTEKVLRDTFNSAGEIQTVTTPPGRGCAFVTFAHRASAEHVINNMQGTTVCGSCVRLSWGK
ncbi:unnamed protein product, partial [Ectocarpus sp. 12 AP-2014]